MFFRRSHLRLPALTAALVLLLAGVADAFGVKACPHHGHRSGRQEVPSAGHVEHGEEVAASQYDADHTHGQQEEHGRSHVGHGEEDESAAGAAPIHLPGHSDCDCGFFCLGVAGPPSVQSPPTVDEGEPFLPAPGLRSFEEYDGDLRPSAVPFLLPYSNGPPTHS